jgi:plasmid maintenance system antidote protein VapI
MRYVIDRSKFYYYLVESGYSNVGAVAKALSINRATLVAYVTGKRSAVSEPVVKLAELFGVLPEDILKIENEDDPREVRKSLPS